MLLEVHDRSELPDITAPADHEDQADEPAEHAWGERITWAEAISRGIAVLYVAFTESKREKPAEKEASGESPGISKKPPTPRKVARSKLNGGR